MSTEDTQEEIHFIFFSFHLHKTKLQNLIALCNTVCIKEYVCNYNPPPQSSPTPHIKLR